jgi:DNA (cytosine-5)-methyltransferase 1
MPKQKEYQSFTTYSDLFASEPYTPLLFQTEREANGALKVLSLFSGCGGMDLGFEGSFICHKKSIPTCCDWVQKTVAENWVLLKSTRFKTIFANDILKEAQQSWLQYMRRFDVPKEIYHFGSIVDYVKMHQKGVNVFPENVDVVTGGFPCQDFSVAGKRKGFESTMSHDGGKLGINAPSEETRGKLYFWMKQVIDIVRPKVFIAENVKGLVSLGDVKSIIQHDFASADGNGYIVLNPRVLDAGNYGVPETRERVIFIGIRRDALNEKALKALETEIIPDEYDPYPKPTHNHTAQDNSLQVPVTCRDVFEELKEPEESSDLSQRNYSMAKYMGKHCQGQSEIKLDGLGPTIRSEHHGNIEFRRLSKEHGGIYTEELDKGMKERRLTPRECALIQTFPPDYPFVFYRGYTKTYGVSPSGAYKVIGNAVPPMLAYNIAQRLQKIWPLYFE